MKIACLVSGGVDSSVALRLLHAEGHDLTAFYLKIWLEDELAHLGHCPWDDDLRQVRAVCDPLGIPVEVVPLQRDYRREVMDAALAELAAGRTPSPDVWCNPRIKFGAFLEQLDPSFERVASGHYARLERRDREIALLRGVDPVKDQTYFLHRLGPAVLERLLFPVGDLPKSAVRERARTWNLPNRDRPDSQGLCFLGDVPYADFVGAHLGQRPGPIRDVGDGRLLGTHQGHWFHTIGQRRGLGLGGGPWFVVAKEPSTDTVWVAHADRVPAHHRGRFVLGAMRWTTRPATGWRIGAGSGDAEEGGFARVRHGGDLVPARWRPIGDRDTAQRCEIELVQAVPGVAPGQSIVLYQGAWCLGGGVVERAVFEGDGVGNP